MSFKTLLKKILNLLRLIKIYYWYCFTITARVLLSPSKRRMMETHEKWAKKVIQYLQAKVQRLQGSANLSERQTIILANHRSQVDFFLHNMILQHKSYFLSRMAVLVLIPLFGMAWHTVWFFNRSGKVKPKKFNDWLDYKFQQSPRPSLVIYPQGHRMTHSISVDITKLKTGLMRYAYHLFCIQLTIYTLSLYLIVWPKMPDYTMDIHTNRVWIYVWIQLGQKSIYMVSILSRQIHTWKWMDGFEYGYLLLLMCRILVAILHILSLNKYKGDLRCLIAKIDIKIMVIQQMFLQYLKKLNSKNYQIFRYLTISSYALRNLDPNNQNIKVIQLRRSNYLEEKIEHYCIQIQKQDNMRKKLFESFTMLLHIKGLYQQILQIFSQMIEEFNKLNYFKGVYYYSSNRNLKQFIQIQSMSQFLKKKNNPNLLKKIAHILEPVLKIFLRNRQLIQVQHERMSLFDYVVNQ